MLQTHMLFSFLSMILWICSTQKPIAVLHVGTWHEGSWTSMITKSKWTKEWNGTVCMQWALLKGSNQGKPIIVILGQCPWATSCLCISENYIFFNKKGYARLIVSVVFGKNWEDKPRLENEIGKPLGYLKQSLIALQWWAVILNTI